MAMKKDDINSVPIDETGTVNKKNDKTGKPKKFVTKTKLLASLWFLTGTAAAYSIEMGIDSALTNYFPEYFETDAKEIIESQNKHFDELKASLSELKREVSSDEGKRLTKQIGALLNQAKADNSHLMISLDAIKQENNNLRRMLSQSKGIDGGTDIRFIEDQAIKIDSSTTIGVDDYNYGLGVLLRISNNGEQKTVKLRPGESTNYTNQSDQNCILAFLSQSPKTVFNFSRTCK